MNDILYHDVVYCRVMKDGNVSSPIPYEAPAYSGLMGGDTVIVDVGYGRATAKVVNVSTVPLNSPVVTFGRVLKTVVYAPFDWSSIDEERKERNAVETEKA